MDSVFIAHDTLFSYKAGRVFYSRIPTNKLSKVNDSLYLVGQDTLRIKGGSGGTIISNSSGTALNPTVTADGSQQDITIPVDTSLSVVSVIPTTIDGSGTFTFRQSGGNLILHYVQAPEGTITYKISVLGGSNGGDTTIVVDHGGGGPPPPAGNSLWTYTLDTSCQIKYGALFSTGSTSNNMVALANVGLSYARVPYNGSGTVNYPSYSAGGYNVLLSYNPSAPLTNSYTALTSDSTAFRTGVGNLLTANGTTNVAGIALINEWNNIQHGKGYWNPISAKNTINLLHAGANRAHELGIKAYDGGATGKDIIGYLVWKDYMDRGYTDSAADFAIRTFPGTPNLANWATDTSHGYRIAYTDSVLTAMQTLPLDGVNIHWKETLLDADSTDASINTFAFIQVVRYLHRKTGKPVITNEFGVDNNTNPDILSQLIDAVETLHDSKNGDMSIAIWYDYKGANADGSLTPFGIALKNKIAETRLDVTGGLQ